MIEVMRILDLLVYKNSRTTQNSSIPEELHRHLLKTDTRALNYTVYRKPTIQRYH